MTTPTRPPCLSCEGATTTVSPVSEVLSACLVIPTTVVAGQRRGKYPHPPGAHEAWKVTTGEARGKARSERGSQVLRVAHG